MNDSYYRIVMSAPQHAELQVAPEAAPPLSANDVAGKTLASLVSAGTELAGLYCGESFPVTPGYSAVFRIEQAGCEVSGLSEGDLAWCMGSHQSWQQHDAASVLRVPHGLSPCEAVFARLMGVSMSTLTTTAARPPHKVLVMGLGPVGYLAAALFAGCGYEVHACDPVPWRCELANKHAAIHARGTIARDDMLAGQFALAIECSGHESALLEACHLVRPGGEVVLVGVPWQKRTALSAFDLSHAVFHRYIHLRSGWEWQLPLQPQAFAQSSIFENTAGALRWLSEGRVQAGSLYEAASPAEAQRVYQGLLHNQWKALAAVFDWTLL